MAAYLTGLVLRDRQLEWETFQQAKGTLRRVAGAAVDLTPPPEPSAPDAEGDAGAAEQGEAARIAGGTAELKGPATLGIGADDLLLRVVELPTSNRDEIGGMVELQADKLSPFPLESMVVSHEVVDTGENRSLVLIAAARADVVQSAGDRLGAAGLAVGRVDGRVLAWWQLLADAGEIPADGRHVAVVLDGEDADILLFADGVPRAFRTVARPAGMPADELAAEVAAEISYTLMGIELEAGSAACTAALWSPDPEGAAMRNPLAAAADLPVEVRELGRLPGVCAGLARRSAAGKGLDLTPDAWHETGRARRFKRRFVAGLSVALGVWLIGVCAILGGLYYQRARLAALQAEREAWLAPAMEVRDLRRRVSTLERYIDTEHSSLECLREITLLQPAGIDLMSFSYTKSDAVKIIGEARDRQLIYDFKAKLDGSALFTNVELGPQSQIRKTGAYSFSVELSLPGGEE